MANLTGRFSGGWPGTFRPYQQGLIKSRTGDTYIRLYGETVQKRIASFFKQFSNFICIGMSLKFSVAAAKFTPPNMGKAYIDAKYYNRPIYSLTDLARGLVRTSRGRRVYATKEDFTALRAGYRFKVVNTRYRATRQQRREAYAYTKGINEAKRLARIQHRGLSKYSWGSMINNIEEDIQNQFDEGVTPQQLSVFRVNNLPPIFQRLLRKSPAIKKFNWGTYDWDFLPSPKNIERISFRITNRLAQIETYGKIAIDQGIRAASKYCDAIWKGVGALGAAGSTTNLSEEEKNSEEQVALKELRKTLYTMFDDIGKTYQAEYLTGIRKQNTVPEGQFVIRRN